MRERGQRCGGGGGPALRARACSGRCPARLDCEKSSRRPCDEKSPMGPCRDGRLCGPMGSATSGSDEKTSAAMHDEEKSPAGPCQGGVLCDPMGSMTCCSDGRSLLGPCRRGGLCGPMGSETSCSDELASTLRHIDAHDEKPPPEGCGADVASTYWWSNVIGHGVISPDGEGTSCSHPFWEARLAILRQIGVVARGGLAKLGGGAPGRPRSRIGCRQGQTP